MPRLRVLAGSSLDELVPIDANSGVPLKVSSDVFEGELLVYIRGFEDAHGNIGCSPYFEHEERKHMTWSIQAQGRFLQPHNANDVMFGNIFERPLKLPWGFSAALKFMRCIDPTLDHDLSSHTQPWALSPLIVTMPHLVHSRTDEPQNVPPFPPPIPITDSTPHLSVPHSRIGMFRGKDKQAGRRKSYFTNSANRHRVTFGPEDVLTIDFCYEYLHFTSDGIRLHLPGISIDMLRYWDGQPVQFVCCERGDMMAGQPHGRVFWCVVIESAEEKSEKMRRNSDTR